MLQKITPEIVEQKMIKVLTSEIQAGTSLPPVSTISLPRVAKASGKQWKIPKKIPKKIPPMMRKETRLIPKMRPRFFRRVLPCLKKMAAPSRVALPAFSSLR